MLIDHGKSHARISRVPWYILGAWAGLIFLFSLVSPFTAFAQESPTLEPADLAFKLLTGKSLTLFTTLNTPVDLANLVVENNGLVNDDKTANIPPDKIILAPASGDISAGLQNLAVTIEQPELPGHYTGEIVLRFDDAEPLTLALDVTVSAAPNVAASAASPNQTLQLRPSFFFLGRCPAIAYNCATPGNQIVITLEQTGLGEASITEAKIDPLRASDNSRPGSVMTYTLSAAGSPPLITTARSLDLAVKAASWDIPPGAYSSGLRVMVADQDAPVVVPFTVKSKAGLFWPALIAALGIFFGFISYRLNQRINPLVNAVKKVDEIQAILKSPEFLQADQVKQFARTLEKIQKRIIAGEAAAAIEADLTTLKESIQTAQDVGRVFISPEGDLGIMMEALKTMPVGKQVAGQMVGSLRQIGERVESGAYESMEAAVEALEEMSPKSELLSLIGERFNEIKQAAEAEIAAGSAAQVNAAELLVQLNTAGNWDELIERVNTAGNLYAMVPLTGFAAGVAPVEEVSFSPAIRDWEAFTTSFKAQRAFGVGLSALFALVGGLIALYCPNATWGASVNDYITLAAWALSVNVIAGQTVDFKAQLTPQVTPPENP